MFSIHGHIFLDASLIAARSFSDPFTDGLKPTHP